MISKSTKRLSLYNVAIPFDPRNPASRLQLEVSCRKFTETEETCCHKMWMSKGERKKIKLPCYAMWPSEAKNLAEKLDPFLEQHHPGILAEIQHGNDAIVSMIITEAARHQGQVSKPRRL